MNLVANALLMLGGLSSATPAQDTLLTRLLLSNRHGVTIQAGRLAGPGGQLLVKEGREARFLLVGEEHGVGEAPELVQALLTDLRPAGYNTFAVEVSPLQGQRLNAMTGPSAPAALDTLLGSWLTAIPFYTLASERRLLAKAMSPHEAAPPMRIWGLDYEVSADRYFLKQLEDLAPAAAQPAVERARALADSGFARFQTLKDPSGLFVWSAPDSVFEDLRKGFGYQMPARAREILDVLQRSARINRLFLAGRVYESNQDRSAWLRQNFIRAFTDAEKEGNVPRVILKFGGSHMMRGWNYTHTLDIGTAAAVLAEARGERSYHILLIGGPGTKNTRMNITTGQYEPIGTAEVDGANLAWLRPALADSGWVVFDLRAVRLAYLSRRSQALTPVQDRFLHAYDAVVVLTGSTPGTAVPLRLRE